MKDFNERPVCHRAEDLVTYLYNEASEIDAQDFAAHAEQCDACRSELALFRQVHESISLWRHEALGASFNRAPVAALSPVRLSDAAPFVQHERQLSALAALREFFSVSPLWLRGATAFAALLLCVLAVVVISRLGAQPKQIANNSTPEKVFTKAELAAAVEKALNEDRGRSGATPPPTTATNINQINGPNVHRSSRRELARNSPTLTQRGNRLTRAEREQLAADLRLIPGRDEEELPFVIAEEPNQ